MIARIFRDAFRYRGDRCANMSPEAKDLVFKMLELDPKKRLSARDVLEHPFIKENQRKREIEENVIFLSGAKQGVWVFTCRLFAVLNRIPRSS